MEKETSENRGNVYCNIRASMLQYKTVNRQIKRRLSIMVLSWSTPQMMKKGYGI